MPPTILLARGVRFRQVFVDQRFGRLHEACADGSLSAARMVSHSATSRPRILMSLSSAGQSRSPAGSSSNCSSSHSTCSRPPQMRASVMLTRSRRHVRRLTVLLIAYVSSPGHGAAAVVRKRYGDMRHHPVWRSAVPMVLVRFEKDAVARVDESIEPPSRWQSPIPSVTQIVWPCGCVCQAVRAPGAKWTAIAPRGGASATASMNTVPVNQSPGPRKVSMPLRVTFMSADARSHWERIARPSESSGASVTDDTDARSQISGSGSVISEAAVAPGG